MKIIKIEFLFKILFLIFLIGRSDCFKTSFGLLKKSNKKANTNTSSQNLYKTNNQNKAGKEDPQATQTPAPQPQQQVTPQTNTAPISTPIANDVAAVVGNTSIPTLPDQPIYAQGWIKYLHYDDAGKQKPKKFWKNTLFEQEQRIKDDNTAPSSDEVNKTFHFLIKNLLSVNN